MVSDAPRPSNDAGLWDYKDGVHATAVEIVLTGPDPCDTDRYRGHSDALSPPRALHQSLTEGARLVPGVPLSGLRLSDLHGQDGPRRLSTGGRACSDSSPAEEPVPP